MPRPVESVIRSRVSSGLGAAAVGAVLMLHDRKDFPWHV